MERYGLAFLLVVIGLFFSFYGESNATFPTRPNLDNILGNQTVVTIVALALVFPLIAGHFDLTVGAIAGLSSIVRCCRDVALRHASRRRDCCGDRDLDRHRRDQRTPHPQFKQNSIITTLAIATLIAGLIQWYTGGLTINTDISVSLTDFGSLRWLTVPRTTYLLALICVVAWYVLEQTPFGRYLRMTGSNASAARLVGIEVDRVVFWTFVGSGFLAGVAGVVLIARNGGANPQDGPGLLFPALAAVFLGSTTIQPGRFNVVGTVLGVFFVAVSVSGLTLSGVRPWVQPVFNGAALLVAVVLSTALARRRGAAT